MGRYYSGDIEGKFWFGVQSSTDPEFFGGITVVPSTVEYLFGDEDINTIDKGIAQCGQELGDHQTKLDEFFATATTYNDDDIATLLGVDEGEARRLLKWYARLELGNKIAECVRENGSCSITADI